MIKQDLDKMLFIDIETVGIEKDYETLLEKRPLLAHSFSKYLDYFQKRFPEMGEHVTSDFVFYDKSALFPEFGRIACFSFGLIKDGEFVVNSYADTNEVDIIRKIKKVLERAETLGMYLVGHNIKKFDVPYIANRMVINDIEPPKILPDDSVKPWETRLIDTKEIWQRSNYSALASLDLICISLGIDSTKNGEVFGSNLHDFYWKGSESIPAIKEYCEKDVLAVYQIINKLKSLK